MTHDVNFWLFVMLASGILAYEVWRTIKRQPSFADHTKTILEDTPAYLSKHDLGPASDNYSINETNDSTPQGEI
jgi:hypothetical protein